MDDLVCPACGSEELVGERAGDLIHITCEDCATAWDRDPSPRCPTCGGDDLEGAIKAVVERSRGTQLSIVGTTVVHLCRACDAEVLTRYRIGRSPLMPADLPTR